MYQKKNSRPIHLNRKTGVRFIGKSAALAAGEQWLKLNFLKARHAAQISFPIHRDVHVAFFFTFKDFYSKDGYRRKTIPDLSNLVQAPEDALQQAGIIKDDGQIVSLDGSRRLPGKENILEVFLWVDDTI